MTAEARKPRRTRYWQWIAATALILCLTLAAAWHSRKRSLLEQSTMLVDASVPWRQPYRWVTDHQFIFQIWQKPTSPLEKPEGLYTYDIHTRQETFLRSVSQELEKGNFENYLDSLCVSPDGTRLLWSQDGPDPVHGAWLDGSHFFTCLPPRNPDNTEWTQARWTSDSRHWVAFVRNQLGATQAVLYDGDLSHQPKTVAATASDHSVPLIAMAQSNANPQNLIVNDHLLVCRWEVDQKMPTIDVLDIGIGDHAAGLKTRHISLPPGTTLKEVTISPTGDRIAWILSMQAAPEWVLLLKRWVLRTHGQGENVEGLWMSRIDGTEMREIGTRTLQADETPQSQVRELQWVPRSKRLSFMYQDAFYTVSAE